jgi:hypothetical protein
MPKNACDKFLTAFTGVSGTGNFNTTGTAPFFLPQLHVTGLGELAFPLPAAQAKAMISLAEAAPYGKGEQTVLDEKVRKCWQLDECQFTVIPSPAPRTICPINTPSPGGPWIRIYWSGSGNCELDRKAGKRWRQRYQVQ